MATNGIDFVIGGKDEASPAIDEVEKSMDKLLDQQIEYDRIQKKVAKSTTVATQAIQTQEKAESSLETKTSKLNIAVGALVVAYGAIKAATALLGGLDKINAAYDQQTASVKKLNSVLNVRGHAAASQGMQDFASQMQKLTGVGDEVTIGLMSQAAEMGFATGAINDATKAAIGLSDVTGKGLEQSLSDVKAALQGNFDAFIGLNPQIMYMRTNQEKLAAVMKIAGQGLNDQSKNMLTVEGSGKRATGAFGDLLESISAILAPVRVLINAGLQQLSESLQSVLVPAVEYANEVLANIGPIMDWVKEKVVLAINIMIGAFTWLEVEIRNLDLIWELWKSAAELAMIYVSETIMHALTEVIPAYAEWWADNFVNIFETAFSLVFTVVSNHISKIIDALKALWEFIASGGSSDILGDLGAISARSYLEGFESSLTSLPEIAGRKLTEREKELAEKIGAIGSRLGDEFTKKMKERMIGVGDTLGSELSSASDKFNLKGQNNVLMQGINATESRLLTRGPASTFQSQVTDQLGRIANSLADVSQSTGDSKENLDRIKEAAQEERKKINLVPAT
tara:strand:- start:3300 stop:5003 length:1704 start_codon:yes stop_codon:yes gene_type:complete